MSLSKNKQMKYIITTFFIVILILTEGKTQQLSASTPTWSTSNIENPALIHRSYLKYDLPLSIDLNYRYQWVNIEDSPKTAIGNIQYFNDDNHIAMGATIINDATNPTSFTGLVINGAYQLVFNKDLYATIGLSGGIYQYRVKGDELNFLEGEDIASQNISKFYPDFSIGASLYIDDFFIGISLPQTFAIDLSFRDANNDFNIQRVRHYNMILGGIFSLYNDSWLEPSLNVKYLPNLPVLVDALLKYERNEIFWLGVGGATSGKVHLETGFILQSYGHHSGGLFRLGYGYNYFFNSYGVNFGSAHEIKLTYSKVN